MKPIAHIALPDGVEPEAQAELASQLKDQFQSVDCEFSEDESLTMPKLKRLQTDGIDMGRVNGDVGRPALATAENIAKALRRIWRSL